ncbi:phosphocarrier protein [Ruminococcus sp. YE71]|uniref:HPr family phosphocarrier protein n=1 Tax=unclassified Ruminococcus TaxID=2608920 RepID=UPI0008828A58|nr:MULTISPECIES: HPr family phosphocarrier protein [unclassified Ruminococcus]SDA13526.1 phosphocarrier protein [Ruminococcus sp. YE78]SFW19238.1 phosphocarrier protein [Ruminococcus sp. YE71]
MKTFTYTIKDANGIHARPAGNLGKLVKGFADTKVTVTKGEKTVDVTKLMMLMGLGVKCGDTVTFNIEGGDEVAAARAVEEFMSANL